MTDFDRHFDDVDVESILARVEQRPLTFVRKRCLYQAPEFVKRLPAEETVEEGTTVSFSCKIVGFPKPTVTWYKDDDVIGEDSRALLDVDDNVHSISLKDVSKCDGGVYRCKAVNLEGSSSNNLYVSVKARARSRKKKKARIVTAVPSFPAIVERVAEENRETLEVELQPESPLTPLYCNISLKSPVSWPAFLGEWAYCMEVAKQDEDLEMGSEDVFDDEDNQTTLNFDSSNHANADNVLNITHQNGNITDLNRNCVKIKTTENCKKGINSEKDKMEISLNANELMSRFQETLKNLPDIHIGLDTERLNRKEPFRDEVGDMKTDVNNEVSRNSTTKSAAIPPKTLELKQKIAVIADDSSVARISVNRSYAQGDACSTFSVATKNNSSYATDFMQNLNQNSKNKQIKQTVQKMKPEVSQTKNNPSYRWWDDRLMEIVLLISGSTFFGLCCEIPPWWFMLYVFLALLIRVIADICLRQFGEF